MHIVLYEPEIPQNTGNIARTCAVTGAKLHLIKPLGFSTSDRYLKRAGLDYWHLIDVEYHENFAELRAKYPNNTFYFATTKGKQLYTQVNYTQDDFLVFGPETRGLPSELLELHEPYCIKIPMRDNTRSLNLSNSVAIVVYEALRQLGFPNLK